MAPPREEEGEDERRTEEEGEDERRTEEEGENEEEGEDERRTEEEEGEDGSSDAPQQQNSGKPESHSTINPLKRRPAPPSQVPHNPNSNSNSNSNSSSSNSYSNSNSKKMKKNDSQSRSSSLQQPTSPIPAAAAAPPPISTEKEKQKEAESEQQAKPSAAAHATRSNQSESEASLHLNEPSQSSSRQQPANPAADKNSARKPSAVQQLASPQIQTPEPKKKKGLGPENENGGGAEKNRQPFSRVWSEEGEILILKTMASHPLYDTKSLYEIIKPHLHGDFTQLQFQEKVKKMKKKFLDRLNNGKARMSSKPHDISCFQLSKRVWGDKREVNGTAGVSDVDVAEEIIMSHWQLVEEPVKHDWEERFKEAYTRILILKQERAKLALEAAKSNRN